MPASTTIHPVFHVSVLRKVIGANLKHFSIPYVLQDDLSIAITLPEIMGICKSSAPPNELEVLVRWEHVSSADATWENAIDFQAQHHSFHLEDKVQLWGGVY